MHQISEEESEERDQRMREQRRNLLNDYPLTKLEEALEHPPEFSRTTRFEMQLKYA